MISLLILGITLILTSHGTCIFIIHTQPDSIIIDSRYITLIITSCGTCIFIIHTQPDSIIIDSRYISLIVTSCGTCIFIIHTQPDSIIIDSRYISLTVTSCGTCIFIIHTQLDYIITDSRYHPQGHVQAPCCQSRVGVRRPRLQDAEAGELGPRPHGAARGARGYPRRRLRGPV